MANTYFVSRHAGAADWATRYAGFQNVEIVSHFDTDVVKAGDKIIGTLPVHLAAAVCAAGAQYHHLVLNLPPEARGKELSADDMAAYGAHTQRFSVKAEN